VDAVLDASKAKDCVGADIRALYLALRDVEMA
jgi:hypothetical protein